MAEAHACSDFFQHLLQLKRGGEVPSLPGLVETGALQILGLKQVHRQLCEATEGLREATAEAKAQLDQSSLQLQNLLYEQQHYEKEIASCRAYTSAYSGARGRAGGWRWAGCVWCRRDASKLRTAAALLLSHTSCLHACADEQLELVPEEEFRSAHPELAGADAHKLMLKRLADELSSRSAG